MKQKEYVTKSRASILDFLIESKDKAVSAKDISDYLSQVNIEVDLSTIYRYLDKLISDEQIKKYVGLDNKTAVYQYIGDSPDCRTHFHLQCLSCGKTVHLGCEYMNDVSKHILDNHGFVISYESTTLYGYCIECQKKSKTS